ncbi:MAG: dienelactone hydrolase [Pirellulales bacterium]|nr:dienelactone hydrolase [Pirellulales bacterium]
MIGAFDASAAIADDGYNPLALFGKGPASIELSVRDADRERDIPLRVYLPASDEPAAVVLFSHGLGGSRDGNVFLGKHWAGREYAAVFVQHPGSDADVWRGKPLLQRRAALQGAASLQNFLLRAGDVPAVLDQLEAWNTEAGHPLHGRLDLARVGMSGHSFGAVTTQAVSGQKFVRGAAAVTEPRIRAAIAFSPSGPRGLQTPLGGMKESAEQTFGAVKIPWLLLTGTRDTAAIGEQTVASRLTVFPALPAGDKYELVLDGAEHSAFNDRALPGDREPRNPNHHRAILAISTAFWDAYLKGNAAAKEWIGGHGVKGVLDKGDRWQKK